MSVPNSNGLPITTIVDPPSSVRTIILVNTAVVAAGSTASDAGVLPVNGFANVTGATGTTGAVLPSGTDPGVLIIIQNDSASDLIVYPPTGGTINGAATDASVAVPAHTQATFVNVDGTAWSAAVHDTATDVHTNVLPSGFVSPTPGGYGNARRNWYADTTQLYECTPSGTARGLVLPGGVATGSLVYLYNGGPAANSVTAYADTLTSDVIWVGDGSTTAASATITGTSIGVFIKVDATHWSYTLYKGVTASSALPTGGSTGQALVKASNTDYDVTWATISGGSGGAVSGTLPTGGTPGQTIVKATSANYAGTWGSLTVNGTLPVGGTPGQTLVKATSVDFAGTWGAVPVSTTAVSLTADATYTLAASGSISASVPTGGTAGSTLIKSTSADYTGTWGVLPGLLPTGGTAGQSLIKSTAVNFDGTWGALPQVAGGLPTGGTALQKLRKITATNYDTEWASDVEVLTASRTYYVATTGNDSNTGLAVGSPFLTIQAALDATRSCLCTGAATITIQIADGTYALTTALIVPKVYASVLGAPLTILGNSGTPANVVITGANAQNAIWSIEGANVWFEGFKMAGSRAGGNVTVYGFSASAGYYVRIKNLVFGNNIGTHIWASGPGRVEAAGNYTVDAAAAAYHILATYGAYVTTYGRTVTHTQNTAYGTYFASIQMTSCYQCGAMTFSGQGGSGQRFQVTGCSIIGSDGATKTTYFPGNSNGGQEINNGLWL